MAKQPDKPLNYARRHHCACGHVWTAQVVLTAPTVNLSGEKTEWCPECGQKPVWAEEPVPLE